MVYFDLNEILSQKQHEQKKMASVKDRFFSTLIDYFIFSPVVAFVIVLFFKKSVNIIISDANLTRTMPILIQLTVFSILLFTFIQTLFIYTSQATLGQKYLKLYINFEEKRSNYFFQIWFRQIGFTISILLLGFPFLSVLYHDKRRTFYDRMCECDVLTYVNTISSVERVNYSEQKKRNKNIFLLFDSDKKYLAASMSALISFSFLILILSLVESNEALVQNISLLKNNITKNKLCFSMDSRKQQDRLKTALALNILNIATDECLESEADQILDSISLDSESHKITESKDKSLAYFSKYYLWFKNKKDKLDTKKYLTFACEGELKSDICSTVNKRKIAGIDSESLSKKILNFLSSNEISNIKSGFSK